MNDIIKIEKINEVYVKIHCEISISYELKDYFKFEVPGAKFSPKYRSKVWDGFIYLFNLNSKTIYAGLVKEVEKFAKARDYEIEYLYDNTAIEFSVVEAKEFIESLHIPEQFKIRDYQLEAFISAIRNKRLLLLSPTASGKSFIIYLILMYFGGKALVIVPRTQLVSQLASDFIDYGYIADDIHKVYQGQEKITDRSITIAIWNSIYKEPEEYFKDFDVIIGDEVHLFKAKSLIAIMEKLKNCEYRIGTTGTLDGSETNELVIQGLFGPVKRVTTTIQLQEEGHVSKLDIKIIVLSYADEIRKIASKLAYTDEMNYIVRNEARNRFILNLTVSLKGNTLLLFQYVEKHGKVMYNQLLHSYPDRKVFYVSGEVDGEDRDVIRKLIENEDNAIIVASFGTFSTGTNMKKLHNLIYASPSKSVIRNLQSIGRALRLHESKSSATLYDIADDLSWKSQKNHTLNHFVERVKTYSSEGFKYKIYNVKLKS